MSADEEMQASCQVGCTLSSPVIDDILDTSDIAVDPTPVRSICWLNNIYYHIYIYIF